MCVFITRYARLVSLAVSLVVRFRFRFRHRRNHHASLCVHRLLIRLLLLSSKYRNGGTGGRREQTNEEQENKRDDKAKHERRYRAINHLITFSPDPLAVGSPLSAGLI